MAGVVFDRRGKKFLARSFGKHTRGGIGSSREIGRQPKAEGLALIGEKKAVIKGGPRSIAQALRATIHKHAAKVTFTTPAMEHLKTTRRILKSNARGGKLCFELTVMPVRHETGEAGDRGEPNMRERLYLKPQLRPCEITIQGKPETFTFLDFTHYL